MKVKLPFLVLSVGQACNLRCKNCANFSPYALPEMRKYPVEDIISDFETLFKAVGYIEDLQIQGGEPLIYKDFHKLIGYLGACCEINHITIATNGMLIPNDDIIRVCNLNHNLRFRISNYPQNRNNLLPLLNKLQAYRIKIDMYDFSSGEALWYNCGGLDTPRENNDNVVAERFRRCDFNGCSTLENGELHRCSRAGNAYKLQGFDAVDGDYVQVRGNKNLYDDLLAYYTPPRFETACRYCNGTFNVRKLPAAEQL